MRHHGVSNDRPLRLSHHQALAGETSRPAAALFPGDAERRQGLDRARGDRAALRSASGGYPPERELDCGISVPESERQDPRDHRSQRAGRRAARSLRIRCHPALSRGEDRQAAAGGSGAALRDHPMGVLPDGLHRADVRPGRLFSTNSPAGRSKTSVRWSAIATNPSACSAFSRGGFRAGNGSWARRTRSPTSPCSAGCAI